MQYQTVMYCAIHFLCQGPTGVSGPKGARGAQGPPVSKILEIM